MEKKDKEMDKKTTSSSCLNSRTPGTVYKRSTRRVFTSPQMLEADGKKRPNEPRRVVTTTTHCQGRFPLPCVFHPGGQTLNWMRHHQ